MNTKESIDWASLPFGYLKTDYNVRASFIDGKWSEIEVSDSEMVNIHMASTCLHYGQEIFEGMKAFKGVDGVVRIFRPEENLKRIQDSAKGLMMEPIPSIIAGYQPCDAASSVRLASKLWMCSTTIHSVSACIC